MHTGHRIMMEAIGMPDGIGSVKSWDKIKDLTGDDLSEIALWY